MKTSIRRCLFAWAILAAAACGSAEEPALARFEFVQGHMGTRFRIVLFALDAATADRASKAAFERIATLDHIMSDYRPDSELMRFCRQAGGPPVKVSADLFSVLAAAQDLARKTDGAFDVTIGPVVRLWRVARLRREMPDAERMARARALVGYRNLRLDPQARTAQLLKEGMVLDLGGIAKGYAADEALKVLKGYGVHSALVAAGGDIAVSKPPPGKKGWLIGIAPFESPESSPKRFLLLHDGAVSTSGDAEQHVVIGGVRYSHIADPKTGMALTGRSSVTVVAGNGTASDSLATAVSVLGPERGLKLINETSGAGVLIVTETQQRVRTYESRFPPPAAAASAGRTR